ncbi:hypothetical protein ACFVR1_04610 [Psychrobacillus sp. NPDC058041]|uniref:hypothetical protein n=1 Tax=Psychrobacillus sp. NPDC058041 TaxID=3346310 RepID=UPI0036DF239C
MKKGVESISNWILYLALAFLIIAITIYSFLQSRETESLNEKSFTSMAVSYSLDSDGLISNAEKKEVEHLVHETNHISKVQIYNVKDIPFENLFDYVDSAKSDYEYSREIWTSNSLFVEILPSGNGSGDWYVITERRSFHTLSVLCLLLGGFLYFILFSSWAMKNAYHQNRLNVRWAFVFMIFNVVGYFIFLLADKNRTNSIHSFS